MNRKVFIVGGGGMVGATAAYSMALQEIVEEIVLIDVNEQMAWGQAADINDASTFGEGSVVIRPGAYREIETDDIVVIASGAPQQPGQTRMELLNVNAAIIREVVGNIMSSGAQPFIIVVANPVDALTYLTLKESGLPKNRVVGTGTMLDTSRLKVTIANALNVSSDDVDAYVLGEHGDSSFSALSGARVGDIALTAYPSFTPEITDGIDQKIRARAYKIIEAKKSTYFAIAQVITQLVRAMQHSTPSILPVSSLAEGEYGVDGVAIGLPCHINNEGVTILEGYDLNDEEKKALFHSADVLREAIKNIT